MVRGNLVCREILVDIRGAYLSSRRVRVKFSDAGDMGGDTIIDTSSEENKGKLIDFIFLL